MKRMQITDRELIAALRRMVPETGSLLCLGCGYERNCSTHGCAVLREAVERLKELTAQVEPLNDPLTLEELRGMDGEPVWIERNDVGLSIWAIVGDSKSPYGVYFGTAVGGLRLYYDECGKTWLAYRRKRSEGTA